MRYVFLISAILVILIINTILLTEKPIQLSKNQSLQNIKENTLIQFTGQVEKQSTNSYSTTLKINNLSVLYQIPIKQNLKGTNITCIGKISRFSYEKIIATKLFTSENAS